MLSFFDATGYASDLDATIACFIAHMVARGDYEAVALLTQELVVEAYNEGHAEARRIYDDGYYYR